MAAPEIVPKNQTAERISRCERDAGNKEVDRSQFAELLRVRHRRDRDQHVNQNESKRAQRAAVVEDVDCRDAEGERGERDDERRRSDDGDGDVGRVVFGLDAREDRRQESRRQPSRRRFGRPS